MSYPVTVQFVAYVGMKYDRIIKETTSVYAPLAGGTIECAESDSLILFYELFGDSLRDALHDKCGKDVSLRLIGVTAELLIGENSEHKFSEVYGEKTHSRVLSFLMEVLKKSHEWPEAIIKVN